PIRTGLIGGGLSSTAAPTKCGSGRKTCGRWILATSLKVTARTTPRSMADAPRHECLATCRSRGDLGAVAVPALVRHPGLCRGGQIRDHPLERRPQGLLDDGA